jgi:type II secretory ATPase GspE/PulE/Tfp pilus assembly ATPase PilB-like protein
MVLSTLHCNDAPSAIPRLLDMGIDPLLLSTSLVGMMSQRLLRQLCSACRHAEAPTAEEVEVFKSFGIPEPVQIYRAVGCAGCSQTGYRGRKAVHEIMAVTPPVGRVIASRAPMDTLCAAAAAHGYEPMTIRALEMVAAGETTMAEAKRVLYLDPAYAETLSANDGTPPLRLAS